MKRALVILDSGLQASGLRPGSDYEFTANVHDEWQLEVEPQLGDRIGKAAAQAIHQAGQYYNFRCPLAGAYSIGQSWAETH
jgi:DNA polymerase-1